MVAEWIICSLHGCHREWMKLTWPHSFAAQPVEKMNVMLSAGRTGSSGYVESVASPSLSESVTKCMWGLNKARTSQASQSQHILSFIYHLHKNHRVSLSFCPCEGFNCALITVGVIIRCHIHVKKVLQFPLQGLECRPVLFFLLPAVHHYVIHDFRAVGRTWHPVAQRNPLDHLQVCHGYNNHRKQLRTFIKRNTTLSVESMYKRIEKAHLGKASVQRSWSHKVKSQRTRHLILWRTCYCGWPLVQSTSLGI